MRLARGVAIAALLVAAARSTGLAAQVDLYGKPGTFGTLGSQVASGESQQTFGIPGWEPLPGQAHFFVTVASDGTVFSTNYSQSGFGLIPTGCEYVITCFNPDQPLCRDEATQAAAHYANFRVPTENGVYSKPEPCTPGTTGSDPWWARKASPSQSDIEMVVDPADGQEKVVFVSGQSSFGAPANDPWPMLGTVTRQNGLWALDASSLRTSYDLAASSPDGAAACPGGNCGGVAEFGILPRSQRIVMTDYYANRIFVTDVQGFVWATYEYPTPENRCATPPAPVTTLGRAVEVDPSSAAGDERFAMTWDSPDDPFQHPLQEYRYDGLHTIAPVSKPVITGSLISPPDTCANPAVNNAIFQYDSRGNLLLMNKSRLFVYLKDPATGLRSLETRCPYADFVADWASPCVADIETGAFAGFDSPGNPAQARPKWSYTAPAVSVGENTSNGLLAGNYLGGRGSAIRRLDAAGVPPTFTSYPVVLFSGAGLSYLYPEDYYATWQAAFDSARDRYWVGVGTYGRALNPPCGVFGAGGLPWCDFRTGTVKNSWLLAYDFDAILGAQPQATAVSLSYQTIRSGVSNDVILEFAIDRNLQIDTDASGVWFYSPLVSGPFQRMTYGSRTCTASTCRYRFRRNSRQFAGFAGPVQWHAVLVFASGEKPLLSSGVARVE